MTAQPASEPAATLTIDGLCNLRDVSASVGANAGLRSRRLFRSDAPSAASAEALRTNLRVECFLDLRSTIETAATPELALNGTYVNVALADVGVTEDGKPPGSLTTDYVRRLTHDPNLPAAIVALARLLPSPTVVFCAAGKDRTGLLIATTLAIIGVRREAIIDDYLQTAKNLDALLAVRRTHAGLTLPSNFYECSEPAMREFLHRVDSDHGGAEQWALRNGISRRAIRHLRDSLHEPMTA